MAIPHSRNIISLMSIIVFIIGAIAHFYADPYVPFSNTNEGYETGYGSGYEAGFTAAKELVKNSSVGRMYMMPDDIRSLSGVVSSVEEKSLTIRVSATDPFEDPALSLRIVTVAPFTKIVRLTQGQEINRAEETVTGTSNNEAIQEEDSPLSVSSPITQTVADFTEIRTGDALTVTATENVKEKQEFVASEISIQARTQ